MKQRIHRILASHNAKHPAKLYLGVAVEGVAVLGAAVLGVAVLHAHTAQQSVHLAPGNIKAKAYVGVAVGSWVGESVLRVDAYFSTKGA